MVAKEDQSLFKESDSPTSVVDAERETSVRWQVLLTNFLNLEGNLPSKKKKLNGTMIRFDVVQCLIPVRVDISLYSIFIVGKSRPSHFGGK